MLVKFSKKWQLPSNKVTSEKIYLNRRTILKNLGFLGISSSFFNISVLSKENYPYNYSINNNYDIDFNRLLTSESKVTGYNNFFEFSTTKNVKRKARKLSTSPWNINIGGLVTKEINIDFEDLIRKVDLEERVYRLRCVEAWSILVPWIGFPLKSLLKLAEPKSSAKYLVMKTFLNPKIAPSQKQSWYPWPYTEVLTIDESYNDLTFIATGIYGKTLPNQNGAPLRLLVPWKYGFKSAKFITRISFTAHRPPATWHQETPAEYGWYSNVYPDISHPRWSQASERRILGEGQIERIPTRPYNGYGEAVAHLYPGDPQQYW